MSENHHFTNNHILVEILIYDLTYDNTTKRYMSKYTDIRFRHTIKHMICLCQIHVTHICLQYTSMHICVTHMFAIYESNI